jgi:hypothetical protein
MTHKEIILVVALFAIAGLVTGCETSGTAQALSASQSQVNLRSFQTRAFDTTNREQLLRTVIATLQDLGFVIDKADAVLGTVSATKLSGYQLKMTVTVRPRGNTQMLVRANAQFNLNAIEDPAPYQDFFTALGKAMFLTAHAVD